MSKPTFKEYREKRYQEEDMAFQLALEQPDLQCCFVTEFDGNEIEYGPYEMHETKGKDGYRVYCGDIKTIINKIILKKDDQIVVRKSTSIPSSSVWLEFSKTKDWASQEYYLKVLYDMEIGGFK